MKIKAFILGVKEFRQQVTSSMPINLIESYDTGREFAHRITFRIFENQ